MLLAGRKFKRTLYSTCDFSLYRLLIALSLSELSTEADASASRECSDSKTKASNVVQLVQFCSVTVSLHLKGWAKISWHITLLGSLVFERRTTNFNAIWLVPDVTARLWSIISDDGVANFIAKASKSIYVIIVFNDFSKVDASWGHLIHLLLLIIHDPSQIFRGNVIPKDWNVDPSRLLQMMLYSPIENIFIRTAPSNSMCVVCEIVEQGILQGPAFWQVCTLGNISCRDIPCSNCIASPQDSLLSNVYFACLNTKWRLWNDTRNTWQLRSTVNIISLLFGFSLWTLKLCKLVKLVLHDQCPFVVVFFVSVFAAYRFLNF